MKLLSTLGGGSWEPWVQMLAIPKADGVFLHNHWTDFESVTWMLLGLTPATRWYRVRLWRTSIHGVRPPCDSGLLSLLILNSMADSSTTAAPILNPSPGRRWARRQLHAGIGYVSGASIPMKSLSTLGGGGLEKAERGCWQSQNSMADSSTTALPILDLLLGHCWARRQLHAGIRYVPVALILMEIAYLSDSGLLSLLILNSMADSSITAWPILNLSLGRRWVRRQLHAGIGYISGASIPMKSLSTLGGGPGKGKRGCWRSQDSMADSSTTTWLIPGLKTQGCWARR